MSPWTPPSTRAWPPERSASSFLLFHLMKLEEAGYVDIEKTYAGKKPLTRVHLNDAGRAAFSRYLEAINALLAPAAQ